jgi:hypothetical protein
MSFDGLTTIFFCIFVNTIDVDDGDDEDEGYGVSERGYGDACVSVVAVVGCRVRVAVRLSVETAARDRVVVQRSDMSAAEKRKQETAQSEDCCWLGSTII